MSARLFSILSGFVLFSSYSYFMSLGFYFVFKSSKPLRFKNTRLSAIAAVTAFFLSKIVFLYLGVFIVQKLFFIDLGFLVLGALLSLFFILALVLFLQKNSFVKKY